MLCMPIQLMNPKTHAHMMLSIINHGDWHALLFLIGWVVHMATFTCAGSERSQVWSDNPAAAWDSYKQNAPVNWQASESRQSLAFCIVCLVCLFLSKNNTHEGFSNIMKTPARQCIDGINLCWTMFFCQPVLKHACMHKFNHGMMILCVSAWLKFVHLKLAFHFVSGSIGDILSSSQHKSWVWLEEWPCP